MKHNPSELSAGTYALFWIQLVSILSFSVLYSSIIFYMTNVLHLKDVLATNITGSFLALNYFLHLFAGYLGGRYFSYRSLFILCMILQVIGCIFLCIPTMSFLLWGLAAFLSGCGLNITCINCLLTQLFHANDKKRESAFLWNYGGQNIGFFMGFLIAGYFDLYQSYLQLFLVSTIGHFLAIALVIYNWKILQDRGTYYIKLANVQRMRAHIIGMSLVLILLFSIRFLLQNTSLCNQLITLITVLMFAYILWLATKQPHPANKNKMWAYCILAIGTIIFWTLMLLAPMGLSLFIERNVSKNIFGYVFVPQWIQNVSTIGSIIFAPLLSLAFNRLRERGLNISDLRFI